MTVPESISYLTDLFPFTIRSTITGEDNLIIGYKCRAGGSLNVAKATRAIEFLIRDEGLSLEFRHEKDNDFILMFK